MGSSGGDTIRETIARLRYQSGYFVDCMARNDEAGARRISVSAMESLARLFQYFRNEEDHGRHAATVMRRQDLTKIANRVSATDRLAMIAAKGVNPAHQNTTDTNLRTALDKVGHFDEVVSTFRIDGGRHILVLTANEPHRQDFWVIDVDVLTLCDRCIEVIQ